VKCDTMEEMDSRKVMEDVFRYPGWDVSTYLPPEQDATVILLQRYRGEILDTVYSVLGRRQMERQGSDEKRLRLMESTAENLHRLIEETDFESLPLSVPAWDDDE